jgi:YesN/AraC family two-component response regulator
MFTLLVVEDERWIRKGLCETIDWEAEGIRLAGEASDGEEALRLVERDPPDMVITDIVMPGMDGIAFLQSLRERKLGTKVIIMSGYSEFEYARVALKNGAFDYVLKPIHEQSILDVVRRCVQELRKEREAKAEMHTLARSAREAMFLARQRLFDMLLAREPYPAGWLEERMSALRIGLDPGRVRVFAVKIVDWGCKAATAKDQALLLYALCNMIEETGRRFGPLAAIPLTDPKSAGEADLAMFQSESSSTCGREPLIASELPWLMDKAGQMLGVRMSIGYSREGDFGRLPDLYEEALHSVSFWFYDGGGNVYSAESLASTLQSDSPYSGPAGWDIRFAAALKVGETKLLEPLIRELAQHIHDRKNSCLPLTVRRGLKLLFQNVNQKRNAAYHRHLSSQDVEVAPLEVPLCPLDAFQDVLLETLQRSQKSARPARSRKWIVERALQYIERNRDKAITLNDVAEHLYLNHSYFSKVFHEEMGETFSRYLVRSRIDKAKKLLKETPLKIYEIAAEVGYNDVRHFTKVFKEWEGLSPAQYREHGL